MNLFHTAWQILAATGTGEEARPALTGAQDRDPELQQAATDLLTELHYLSPGGRCELSNSPDEVTRQNRLALLALAARFERAFQLPMRHAPGAAFFGGMVSPAAFGIRGHGETASGVGGRGRVFQQAFESCIGEAAEFLSFIEWDDEPRLLSWTDGSGLTGDELSWALAGIGLEPDTGLASLDWIEATSLSGDAKVLLPSELVLRRPENRRTGSRQAESNGVGAGPTIEAAVQSGLMECIERDAVALWWFGGRPAKAPHPDVTQDRGLTSFVQECRAGSSRPVWFLDISGDIEIPVIAALSSERDGTGVIAGFAAELDPHVAVRKAFLEMCQMELAQEISLSKLHGKQERQLQEQDKTWIDRYNRLNITEYPRLMERQGEASLKLNSSGRHINTALDALDAVGLKGYFINLTRQQIAVPVARVVVSGLQSAKPDWLSQRLKDTVQASGGCIGGFENFLSPI